MALKKQERKESYKEIQRLMIEGKNKEAFDKLCLMCGSDTGAFLLVDYDKARADFQESVSNLTTRVSGRSSDFTRLLCVEL